LYVFLCPPGRDVAMPLPLAGLSPFFKAVLAGLVRGALVPEEIVVRLLELAPRSALELDEPEP